MRARSLIPLENVLYADGYGLRGLQGAVLEHRGSQSFNVVCWPFWLGVENDDTRLRLGEEAIHRCSRLLAIDIGVDDWPNT